MDKRFAMLAANLMAALTGKDKEYDNYMLYRDEDKPEAKISLKDMKAAFHSFAEATKNKRKSK